ncbi:hypothetical protein V8G54_035789 [Vigna mungo]|uniref:WW domain-containing protein n=1 Tax=Vigna mungo TaxID=3915 RepID=A0AAQ3MG47_VIGMU
MQLTNNPYLIGKSTLLQMGEAFSNPTNSAGCDRELMHRQFGKNSLLQMEKYYYNKVTQQSTWSIPEELQLAREQAQKAANQGMQSETSDTPNAVVSSIATSTAANAASLNPSLTSNGPASSPSSVIPIASTDSQQLVSGLLGASASHSTVTSSTTSVEPSSAGSAAPVVNAGSSGLPENSPQLSKMQPMYRTLVENQASQDFASANGSSPQNIERARLLTCENVRVYVNTPPVSRVESKIDRLVVNSVSSAKITSFQSNWRVKWGIVVLSIRHAVVVAAVREVVVIGAVVRGGSLLRSRHHYRRNCSCYNFLLH